MLDEDLLRSRLPIEDIGAQLSFHTRVGSTNDVAAELAKRGAPHGTIVVAQSQTRGRGRGGRRWLTKPGSGLAVSLVLRPLQNMTPSWPRLNALGGIAIAHALEDEGLHPQVKWPNDVLLEGKKVAGVLVEPSWVGDEIDFIILGMGINLFPDAVRSEATLDYPATSLSQVADGQVDANEFLHLLLRKLAELLKDIGSTKFIERWEDRLAFRNKWVRVETSEGNIIGEVLGLASSGNLRIRRSDGEEVELGPEGSRLRPLE
jgi:BirA family biotin operon repressor/biotin-[acetyl-CoA-carboxylase] ligase